MIDSTVFFDDRLVDWEVAL